MIPKEFFVTNGKAVSPVSEVKAFDLALKKISVSSITFTVMARTDRIEGWS